MSHTHPARQEENLVLNLGLLIISSVLFSLGHVTFPSKMPHLSSVVISFQCDFEIVILTGERKIWEGVREGKEKNR